MNNRFGRVDSRRSLAAYDVSVGGIGGIGGVGEKDYRVRLRVCALPVR